MPRSVFTFDVRRSVPTHWNPLMTTLVELVRDVSARWKDAVERADDSIAIEHQGRVWSHSRLDAVTDAVAASLRDLPADSVTVIDCERGPELVVAMVACVKARRTFFVVGENQPEAYVARLLTALPKIGWVGAAGHATVERAIAIAGPRLAGCVLVEADGGVLRCDVPGDRRFDGDDDDVDRPMYLVATSGTTGQPKLVESGEAAIVNFIAWYRRTFSLTAHDRFALLSGLGCDPLIRDVFVPLSIGACIVIPGRDAFASRLGLRTWLKTARVGVIHATPPLARVLFDHADEALLPEVRLVAIGGAPLTTAFAARLRRVLPRAALVNVYGTSETPQVMTFHVVGADDLACAARDGTRLVPLGRPIDEVAVEVRRRDGGMADIDESGEIHVVSAHLALGYRGDPDQTMRAFDADDVSGRRRYRTGDLGRIDADGRLHYVGRGDRRVKHRGYRIHLEEIEEALAALDDVALAAVLHDESEAGAKIVGHVQPVAGAVVDGATLQRRLLDRLPSYMVPERWLVLASLPLTAGNKIDYRALAAITSIDAATPRSTTAAASGNATVARRMLSIWSEILSVPSGDLRLNDNFFDVGGNSLLSTRLIEQVNTTFASRLKTTDLFVHSSIGDLAKHVESHHIPVVDVLRSPARAVGRADRLAQVHQLRNKRARSEL